MSKFYIMLIYWVNKTSFVFHVFAKCFQMLTTPTWTGNNKMDNWKFDTEKLYVQRMLYIYFLFCNVNTLFILFFNQSQRTPYALFCIKICSNFYFFTGHVGAVWFAPYGHCLFHPHRKKWKLDEKFHRK